MRVIVPLQGVVQGRGGLVLGSLIPCALYYFLQLYLKQRRRPDPPPPSPSSSSSSPGSSPSTSLGQLAEFPFLPRTLSRSLLSPRGHGGPVYVSGRGNSISKGSDSSYYVGLRKVSEDPYDEVDNPGGIIQLGLAEHKVGFFLFFHCWV